MIKANGADESEPFTLDGIFLSLEPAKLLIVERMTLGDRWQFYPALKMASPSGGSPTSDLVILPGKLLGRLL
jgi:hypothetical protein